MEGFEWIEPLSIEEKIALTSYKNYSDPINGLLRKGKTNGIQEEVRLLDQAIAKGRFNKPVALFRGGSTSWLDFHGDLIRPSLAFLSTSKNHKSIGKFIEQDTPAILVINCPINMPIAAFEHDAKGEEEECLLPRGITFRVNGVRIVQNRSNIYEPEGPFNYRYNQLSLGCSISIYSVEPACFCTPVTT